MRLTGLGSYGLQRMNTMMPSLLVLTCLTRIYSCAWVSASGFRPLICSCIFYSSRMAAWWGSLRTIPPIFSDAINSMHCVPPSRIWGDDLGRRRLKNSRLSLWDFTATVTQKVITNESECLPTSPAKWADRQRFLSIEETRSHQCEPGELRPLVTVPRPNAWFRHAQLAAVGNAWLDGDRCDAAREWQSKTISKNQSDLKTRDPRHSGWSEATYGVQTDEGRCPLGYLISLLPPSMRSSRRLIHW